MRCVFAVGSDMGWPVEVWVLFSIEAEARRHADAAAYEFRVFPLPVYDSYDDYPRTLRPDGWNSAATLRAVSEEADFARAFAANSPTVEATPVYAASDFESTRLPEVRALYETPTEAERHVAAAPGALSSLVMDVYASYEACPAERRFDRPESPLSQHIRPRR
jgi:hypothetical protein